MGENFQHTLLYHLFRIVLIPQDRVRNEESPPFIRPNQFVKNLFLPSQHPFDEEYFGRASSDLVFLHRVQRRVAQTIAIPQNQFGYRALWPAAVWPGLFGSRSCKPPKSGLSTKPSHSEASQPRSAPKAACARVTVIGKPLEN